MKQRFLVEQWAIWLNHRLNWLGKWALQEQEWPVTNPVDLVRHYTAKGTSVCDSELLRWFRCADDWEAWNPQYQGSGLRQFSSASFFLVSTLRYFFSLSGWLPISGLVICLRYKCHLATLKLLETSCWKLSWWLWCLFNLEIFRKAHLISNQYISIFR